MVSEWVVLAFEEYEEILLCYISEYDVACHDSLRSGVTAAILS
jgi:hypothetical protein